MAKATESMAILCDNTYRRIKDDTCLAHINITVDKSGNLMRVSQGQLGSGAFVPTSVTAGEFTIFAKTGPAVIRKAGTVVEHEDFVGKYLLTPGRTLSELEQSLIPKLPEWYIIPPEVVAICQHAQKTTGRPMQMRNFLLRGPAGTGKTMGAKAIAAGLGLPYMKYAKTPEELFDKVEEAKQQIENAAFRRVSPTVAEYGERWLTMQSARIRTTTLIDYTSKVKNYIIAPLGHMYMAEVTADDIKLAMVNVSSKSSSVYRSAQMLYKCIFYSAVESKIIDSCPCEKLSAKGGKPQDDREALTDEQVEKLLAAIKGLPPYVFVMIGLYAGLRREEILALKWDCVFLDADTPYLSVQRAWHSEHNRPVISRVLKTKAAKRDIPLPPMLADCLREAKDQPNSEFVIANRDGGPLSYTQFKRVWQYIVTRSTKERTYVRYLNGQKITHTVTPVLGERAAHNSDVVYSLDFQVTPHQLRHTYITNLIYFGTDPKTVQYLAGHQHSKITMDIYAKVKYNKPSSCLRW